MMNVSNSLGAHRYVILSEVEGSRSDSETARFLGYARNDSETTEVWQTIQATK